MERLLAILVLGGLLGCATTKYVPQVRQNRASLVATFQGVKMVVNTPTILAISLKPPFECNEATRRLARDGPMTLADEPEDVKAFSDFRSTLFVGAYRVSTYAGEELEPGPIVLVMSGTDTDHPGTSALNVMNRYNDVAECVDGQR